MSDAVQNACKEIGRWLNRLRFKSVWVSYDKGEINYAQFKDRVFVMVNDIRRVRNSQEYTRDVFDSGWQYLTVGHENYKIALAEMVNLVFGWW